MSTLAVFMALSGGAYAAAKLPANSVSTRQLIKNAVTKANIKSNSIDSSKVAPNALIGADIKEASLAKVPAAALADSATNATHANAAGAIDKLTYKTAAASVAPTDAFGGATATCDAGQHVTGGGVQGGDPSIADVIDSYPDGGGTAWTAHIGNLSTTAALTFTVYAICTTAATVG
jgi:hypothetical protein